MKILFCTTEYEILQIKPHSRTVRTCHFLELQILDFKIVVDHNWIEQIAVEQYSVEIADAKTLQVQSRFARDNNILL